MNEGETIKNSLLQKLQLQKASFVSEGHVDAKTRIDRIERSINLLKKNEKDLIQAMAAVSYTHLTLPTIYSV